MQRFGFDHFGAPAVFTTISAPRPEPKPGQVQLHVLGFGLNPYDASLRRGEQQDSRPLPWPIVPGTDVLGRITALGAGVSGLAVGDLVMNYRPLGGYSDFVTASANKVLVKPSALSFLDAAALPQVGIAAYTILEQLNLPKDAMIAILGAGGGVGSVLVQLAKCRGLQVVAIASPVHHAHLEALGADATLNYDQAARVADHQADAVVNTINGGHDHNLSTHWVAPGGTITTTAYTQVPDGDYHHIQLTKMAPVESAFNFLATVARTWGLSMQIAERLDFSLAGVRRGHALLEAGHVNGKLVALRPDAELNAVRVDRNVL